MANDWETKSRAALLPRQTSLTGLLSAALKKQCPPQSQSIAANHYIIGSELPQPPAQQPPCETRIISQFSRRRIPMIPASLASLASAPSSSREVRPRREAEQEIPPSPRLYIGCNNKIYNFIVTALLPLSSPPYVDFLAATPSSAHPPRYDNCSVISSNFHKLHTRCNGLGDT